MSNSNAFELYRYRNSDGSTKDWAISRNPDGTTYTKRWGKTGTKLQSRVFQDTNNQYSKDISGKTSKGYRYIGLFNIDDNGKLIDASTIQLSSTAAASAVAEPQQLLNKISWRVKVQSSATNTELVFFQGLTRGYCSTLLSLYPENAPVNAIYSRYSDIAFIQSESGFLHCYDGVISLILFMVMKKFAPNNIRVSIAHDDGTDISDQIKIEFKALEMFGTDFESVRLLAESVGLVNKRIDISSFQSSVIEDCYF
ncbi:hypothetical protein [Methylomonas sp. AM2-LC]|uniref:hypothetical protein n=1 Tax=Methylomonas sp. AM2-LC TaxID=3153301 RepID=UPI003264D4E7